MTDVLEAADHLECVTCGHEWPRPASSDDDSLPVVKDANGNVLTDGDTVTLVKDLKLKGGSGPLKAGTKVKGIRLVDAAQNAGHDVDAKVGGMGVLLKGQFLKKA